MTDSPTVRLKLRSQPESLTLVRGALTGIGETLSFDPELLDDMKTAISEACNNVVLHAYPDGPGELSVVVRIGQDRVEATVRDRGTGIHGAAGADDRMGVGLALISALTDRAEFVSEPDKGTEVQMTFKGQIGRVLDGGAAQSAADAHGPPPKLDGDVVVTVWPPALLAGVLGRLARGLAAVAGFSVDRFSDLYLVVDTLDSHARASASSPRLGFAASATERRLELAIGPFQSGSLARLRSNGDGLVVLADELSVERTNESEILRVVVCDQRSR